MNIKLTIKCAVCQKVLLECRSGELVANIFPHALATTCTIEHGPEHPGVAVAANWTTEILENKIIKAPPGFVLPKQ